MIQRISLYLLLISLPLCFAPDAHARRAKKAETPAKYEKLFKGKQVETVGNHFITLHKMDGKLYFEIPLETMGREMLLSSSVAATTYSMVGFIGSVNSVLHFRFCLQDSTVQLRIVSSSTKTDRQDAGGEQILRLAYAEPVVFAYDVLAYTPDSSAVVIDVTPLFLSDVKELSPLNASSGRYEISGSMIAGHSLLGDIHAYDDNVTIKSSLVYNATAWFSIFPLMRNSINNIETNRTLVMLPEERMEPRVYDSRVGVFTTTYRHIPADGRPIYSRSYAHRWRLEPRDKEAYFKGELTEPVKPIVMYIDSNFPESWKTPIKTGILNWNKAFEKIGFKNAIQVRDFPVNDPTFDPSNLRYSCVRYVPFTLEDALASTWVDPVTGEIIQANILVFNDVAWAINQWRFVQTAQVDPSVRTRRMPDHIMAKSLEYVAAHEMGHCLGLMHNMGASSCYPVDSLRSPLFTSRYGLSPSIMDYVRFNYVAQPGDTCVLLEQTTPGPYDEFMIRWLYTYLPDTCTMEQKQFILQRWIDEKAGNPYYRYAPEQTKSTQYDPSALAEDLGDDPIRASDYGIANLKYIIDHIDTWITDDASAYHREELYKNLTGQFERYLTNVASCIGGIYLANVKDGTPGQAYQAVPREQQARAVAWVLRQLRESDWLDNRELIDKFGLGLPNSWRVRNAILTTFFNRIGFVTLSSHVASDPYTMQECMEDVYRGIWDSALAARPLTRVDKLMQKQWMAQIRREIVDVGGNRFSLNGYATPNIEDYTLLSPQFGQNPPVLQEIEVGLLDERPVYFLQQLKRCKVMLEKTIVTAPASDKPHYRAMLLMATKLLERK